MAEPISSNMRDNGVDAVSEVNPTKLSWSLVVGVVRLYEMQNQWNPAEVYSVEMVLQDEQGDRIHCSIPKQNIAVFKTLIREHELYSMKNFIVKGWGKGIRTCDHKYKLNFYIKTSVSRLTTGTFPFNPFRFVSYEEVQAMPAGNENHLIDYIGHVVGRGVHGPGHTGFCLTQIRPEI
ncbi:uncharacterized protein LOC130963254 [Arachis stenosperma]|uniref:uncharacterized protein LOC130963254 n=1 Tax=Arachis stenosperma TaxID=217475 RepID=UPI0025AC6D0C|nr:uncharacterized protein LOC130963254 [Arachis stenosperma]